MTNRNVCSLSVFLSQPSGAPVRVSAQHRCSPPRGPLRPEPLILRLYNLSLSSVTAHIEDPSWPSVRFSTRHFYSTVFCLYLVEKKLEKLIHLLAQNLLTLFKPEQLFVVMNFCIFLCFCGHSFMNNEASTQGNFFYGYETQRHSYLKWLFRLNWGYNWIKNFIIQLPVWLAACAAPPSLFDLFLFMYCCDGAW